MAWRKLRIHGTPGHGSAPFRSDNARIPFVRYAESSDSELLRFVAEPPDGFSYPLGRAVFEGQNAARPKMASRALALHQSSSHARRDWRPRPNARGTT